MTNFSGTRIADLVNIACSELSPTRDVLECMNLSTWRFFVVLDEEGRLVGTLTDGDVRRAMLSGATIDDPVGRCMHRDAIVGRQGDDVENTRLLAKAPFLPILDADDRVVEVQVRTAEPEGISTALVMAGGRGSRLGEYTDNLPKPLIPVGGQPILEHILDELEEAEIGTIFVALHYMAEKVEAFLDQRENKATFNIIREDRKLGTVGALGLLPEPQLRPILVINGDLMTRTDYLSVDSFHWRHDYDATIAVAQYETEVPYGVVQHDPDGLFLGIDEKPALRHFVAAGIYYLSPEFCSLVPQNEPMDMPDLLNRGREVGLRIGLFPIHEYWRDVGKPDDLEAAAREHVSMKEDES